MKIRINSFAIILFTVYIYLHMYISGRSFGKSQELCKCKCARIKKTFSFHISILYT